MADFEAKLRWLSERGNRVGAEDLIERIEADMAGDPLVVVAKRREGAVMTKTQEPPTTRPPNRSRGPAWALAAFVAIVAVGIIYLAFDRDEVPIADTTPPTTVASEPPNTLAPEATGDLAVIEEAVAAYYSGDSERAVELFELPDRSDDEIRADSAYQAAIGGRLSLFCNELGDTPGRFNCRVPYHNVLTDAIGHFDGGDINRVVVEEGLITQFEFPEHSFIMVQIGTFLALEDRFEGYERCVFGPFPESCASIQTENLDAWVDWRRTVEPELVVEKALESWFGGDCLRARHLSDLGSEDCEVGSDPVSQTVEYESLLAAEVSLDGCESVTSNDPEFEGFSCEVRYSNAMNEAVGEPASVTVVHFDVGLVVGYSGFDKPWHAAGYPADAGLRESFTRFAEAGELASEYAAADCASARSPDCANLILANLDDWAAWYETNG